MSHFFRDFVPLLVLDRLVSMKKYQGVTVVVQNLRLGLKPYLSLMTVLNALYVDKIWKLPIGYAVINVIHGTIFNAQR